MRIIDAFTFLNEVDLVKARLEYLNDIVTDFVIVESNQTWRHQPNEPIFSQILKDLDPIIKSKIHHVVVEWPDEWLNHEQGVQEKWVENGTRERALDEIKKFGDLDDWVIMNDLDEFWDSDSWKQATELYEQHGQLVWIQSNRTCFVDWETTGMPNWPGSKMAKLKDITSMSEFYCSKNKATRVIPGKYNTPLFHSMPGGWHFTKMGNMETKAKSMNSIREWRSWETKIGKSAEEAALEIFKGNGWNSVAKKGKMKAEFVGEKNLTPRLLDILKKYPILWCNGLKPDRRKK
jgi:beta-1,4-mannosyl-glycoprotein beta-1,4-N-acetylglucosaminyltransferase